MSMYRKLFNKIISNDYDMDDLIKLHSYCCDMYYESEDESPLSDSEFDIIDKIFKENVSDEIVGSEVRGEKIPLPCVMGSLIQTYIGGETLKWVTKNGWLNEDFVITDKQDGNSGALDYNKNGDLSISYSRGNGIEGSDTTRHIKRMNIPTNVGKKCIIRTEIEMDDDTFFNNKHNLLKKDGTPYENPRNYVSGKMNAETSPDWFYKNVRVFGTSVVQPEMSKIDQLEFMKKVGFDIPEYIVVKGHQLTDEFLSKYLTERREKLKGKSAIDGIVIDINDVTIREKVGLKENSKNPDYARKFKIPDENNFTEAEVEQVVYEPSGYGYMKPRVEIKPIRLNGVTITFATGHNAKFILENKVGKGAIIKLTRSGDVIPYIDSVIKGTKEELPDETVYGKMHWSENNVDLILDNPENNRTAQINKLINTSVGWDIPNLKDASIEKLFDSGVTKMSDIIKLDIQTLKDIVGNSAGEKIFNGFKEKLNPILPTVLAGKTQMLGRGIGSRKLEKLFQVISWDDFLKKNFTKDDVLKAEGWSEKTYNTMMSNIDTLITFISEISGHYTLENKKEEPKGNKFDFGFIFTGVRDKEFQQYLIDNGAKEISSIKAGNNYLICKDKTSSSNKMIKAKEILGENNILELDEAKEKWK